MEALDWQMIMCDHDAYAASKKEALDGSGLAEVPGVCREKKSLVDGAWQSRTAKLDATSRVIPRVRFPRMPCKNCRHFEKSAGLETRLFNINCYSREQ